MSIGSFFDKWGGRGSTIATFWPILGLSGFVGALSAYFARGAAAISHYGAFGWWFCGVIGALATALVFAAVMQGYASWHKGAAFRKWNKPTDGVNPLENEHIRKRIKLSEFVHPGFKRIRKKRFIECEIIGPGVVFFGNDTTLSHNAFIDCDLIPTREQVVLYQAILWEASTADNCKFVNVTLLLHPHILNALEKAGLHPCYASLTGNAAIDGRLPQGG